MPPKWKEEWEMVFQKNQPAGEENGSRSAALGWSWEIFSFGILNVKPSLQKESMKYSVFQQCRVYSKENSITYWEVFI